MVDLSDYAGDTTGVQIVTTTTGPHFGTATAGDSLYGTSIYANGSTANQALEISGLDKTKTYIVQVMVGGNSTAALADFDMNVFLDGFDSGLNLTWNNNSDDGITGIYNLAKVTVWGQDSLTIDLQKDSAWGPGISGVMVREQPTNDFPFVLVPDLVPARGAETVDETANLQLTFDQTITKGTGNIRIMKVSDDSVVETINVTAVTVVGAVVTIDPVSDLPLGEDLYVEIDSTAFNDGAIDFPGFDGPGDWNFTVRPTTVTMTAANGTTGPNTPPSLRDDFGLVKLALNLGGADITYDGIDFTGSTATSGTNTVVFGAANGITVGGTTDGTAWATATGIVPGSYADTFGTEAYPTGSDMTQTINISGLDAAETYQIQLMHGEDRSIGGSGFDYIGTLVATGSDAASAQLTFGDEDNDDDTVFGVVTIEVTGTSNLDILYPNRSAAGLGDRDPSLAGIVIKEKGKWVTTFTNGTNSVSGPNLLATNVTSASGVSTPDPLGVGVISDGVALTSAQYSNDTGWQNGAAQVLGRPTDATVMTFAFDTTVDIESIDIFHGYKNSGRDGFELFNVEVSTDLGSTWVPTIDYNGPMLQGASFYGKSSFAEIGGGLLASNVNALRLTWPAEATNSWENGFGPLSEIVVTGTAAPIGPSLVLPTIPADDSTNVAIDTNLVATFDANVKAGTGNIVIESASGIHEIINVTDSGKVTITGATVTINPSVDLVNETVYWVNITGGAILDNSTDAAYIGLFGTTAWSFQTPVTPPTVIGWSASESGPIFANKFVTYTVTFDKDMDGSTVGTGDFGNAGSSDLSILSVTETSPTEFDVAVQPTSAGTLILEITGAMESDDGGVLAPTADSTVINVSAAPLFQGELGVLDVVNANGGINPATGSPWADGDTYRLLFKTSTTTAATSSDIATYNTFVQNAASAAGLGTGWKAVGSTDTVDAVDNCSARPGTDPQYPFFLIDGVTLLTPQAPNYNYDLFEWQGPEVVIALDENGNSNTANPWTGSQNDGTHDGGLTPWRYLGDSTLDPWVGNANSTENWLRATTAAPTSLKPMYAMSGVLTLAVPGPVGPAITGFSPVGVSGVALGTNLVITYDKDVQVGTGNITIGGGTSPIVIDVTDTGQVTISGDTVTINPTSDLASLTDYWVQVENGAIAEDTTAIPATGIFDMVTWTFTTVDGAAPTVASIADNRGGGPIFENQTVTYTVTFSEDMNAGTIDASDFDNAGSPAATINQVSGSGVTYLVTVTPGGTGTLTLRISGTGITDLSGNPLAVPVQDGDTITVNAGDAPLTAGVVTLSNQNVQPPVEQYGTTLYAYNLGFGTNVNGGSSPPDTSVHQGLTFTNIAITGNHASNGADDNGHLSLSDYADDDGDTIQIDMQTDGPHYGGGDGMNGDLFGSGIWANSSSWQELQITGLEASKAYTVEFGSASNGTNSYNTSTLDVWVDGVDSGENIGWNVDTSPGTDDYGYGRVTFTGKTDIDIRLNGGGPSFGFVVLSEVILPGGNDYSDWIAGYPGVGGLTAFNDDSDNDGNDNGVENYFGTDPGVFSEGVVSGGLSGNIFTFTHPLNATPADDISAAYLWSTDLATFYADGDDNGAGTTVTFSQGVPSAGMVTVTATITGPVPAKLFVNIEVTQTP